MMVVIIGIIVLFIGDLLIKRWARKRLGDESITKADGNVRFNLLYNEGAAMGKLSSHKKVLNAVTVAVLGVLIFAAPDYIKKNANVAEKLGYTIATAGAFNNSYERLFKGKVTDYISFPKLPGKLKEIVFNISDFFIMIGAVLMFVGSLTKK